MSTLESPPSTSVRESASKLAGLRTALYSALVIFPLLALLTYGLLTAASTTFLDSVSDPYLQISDYAYTRRNVNCQVVIYGDSSALTGVNPRIIEQNTHLKTCNISVTMSAFVINGTLAFDRYLAENKRPKYVIIQLAAETFYPDHNWSHLFFIDGIEELLRQGSKLNAAEELVMHPQETTDFLAFVLKAKLLPDKQKFRQFREEFKNAIPDYYKTDGLLTLPKPPETKCAALPSLRKTDLDTAYIRQLRAKYQALGITVLVNVSPVPECEARFAKYQKELATVTDNQLTRYPIGEFNDMDRHFTLEGSATLSREVSDQIERFEAQPANQR